MSFISKIFRKKHETLNGPYFKINKRIIEDPIDLVDRRDTMTVAKLMEKLTPQEKDNLHKICDFIQEGIQRHFEYLISSKFVIAKMEHDKMLIFKSYFELTSLYWVMITNNFRQQKVRDEIGHALWWTIKYSFSGLENIFTNSPYGQYDKALQAKQDFYIELLNRYFKPRQVQAPFDAFDAMIEKPLLKVADEVDRIMTMSQNITDKDKAPNTIVFNKILSENIVTMDKQMATIKF